MIQVLKLNKIISFFLFFSVLSFSAKAQYGSLDQYRAEIGIMGGTSFYIGDANPNALFHRSDPAFGLMVRCNLNPRYAFKFSAVNANVSGDTRDFPNKFPGDEYAYFERNFWDISAHLEFNFVDYGLPDYMNGSNWFSPYIFLGAGLTSAQSEGNDLSLVAFNFPFGLGIKCKLYHRLNVGLEWSLNCLFIDDFDVVDNESAMLDNPYGFADMGNKNNDKYSMATLFVSIDLFKYRYCK